MTFPRANRLISKHDFSNVFEKPRKLSSKHLKLLYRTNTQSSPRLGIIVAKHRVKLSVDRNRIRRIIRESFRTAQAGLSGIDIVILLKSKVSRSEGGVLRQELADMWLALAKTSPKRE